MAAGSTLRILDERHFEVVWTADGWQTTQTALSRSLGSAGFSADIIPGRAATLWNGPSIGRNRTPGLDTMLKSRLMPTETKSEGSAACLH